MLQQSRERCGWAGGQDPGGGWRVVEGGVGDKASEQVKAKSKLQIEREI